MNADQRNKMAAELETWWLEKAQAEVEATVPKAVEYSATDLFDMGRDLLETMGRDPDSYSAGEIAELGVYMYLLGKVSRWKGAIKDGRRVSDDSLFDIGVYVRMAQRIRTVGGWPGVSISEASDGISEGLKTGPGVLAPIRRSEATEDPTTCPECGCAANHEYGCKEMQI